MAQKYISLTRGGEPWDQQFVTGINQADCIGCGRCYKVCPRDVFELVEVEGNDDFGDYGDYENGVMMAMSLANESDCIGCGACSRVCVKKCHQHTPASQL